MHEVQAFTRFGVPPTTIRRRWMFGFQRRDVRRCENEMLLQKPGPLPQTSQLAATGHSKDFRCTYGRIPASPDRDRRIRDLSGTARGNGPIGIGQPEQHTTTASVQRNYHGDSAARSRPSFGGHRSGVYAASHVQPAQGGAVAQVPETFLDALAVRTWCGLALRALGRAREEIDAINVYPVADGDTGTNLYLTAESAAAAVEAVFEGHDTHGSGKPALADAARAMA